ncbi:MAG: hypothetical protein A2283_03295 [Lentisphaerae bacterium RIFOXYA12_FULL_48_11]|nr:MAG: hypothetical protein A2283_03295 [Lentisphaerae bacterium RIFOXYA12_FULL_48_11]
MPECELLKKCAFFNDQLANMPGHAELFKDLYCRRDNKICARYMIAEKLGRESIPKDLFPNHVEMAKEIITYLSSKQKSH